MKTRAVRVAGENEPRKDLTNERMRGKERARERDRERRSELARRPGVGS